MSFTTKLACLLRPLYLMVLAVAIATGALAAPPAVETKPDPRREADALIRGGQHAEGVALCQTIVNDSAADNELRFEMGLKAANSLRNPLGQPEAAEKTLKTLESLKLTPQQKVSLQNSQWILAVHGYKVRDLDLVELRGKTLINNTDASLTQRADILKNLIIFCYSARTAEDKARPLAMAEAFLAENKLDIAPEVGVREMLQRTYNALGDETAATTQARAIFSAPTAPPASRIAACEYLSGAFIAAGDLKGARALLREPLAFPDLNPSLIAKILDRVGRTYLLQDQLDEALKVYKEADQYFKTPEMTQEVTKLSAKALVEFLQFEKAAQLWLAIKQPLEAADIYDLPLSPFADKARALRLAVLEDTTRPAEERRRAYPAFLTQDRADVPIAVRYHDVFITDNTNGAIRLLSRKMVLPNGLSVAFYGDFEGSIRYFMWLKSLVTPNPDFKTTLCAINAYVALGRFDDAVALAKEAIEYKTFTPQEVYQMKMTVTGLAMRDPKADENALHALFVKADAAATKATELTSADRASAIEFLGATLLHARLEPATRASDKLRVSLYAPEPRKHYTVNYSATPISGLDAWQSFAPKTEKQSMDRKYGGTLEFLATDVSTGDRGAGIGGEADAASIRFPEISFISDVNGLHFRCETFDPQAREVEAKLLGAGSFEGYIAPGENQPYICYLIDAQTGTFSFYNTTYENRNHRRITTEDPTRWRGEHRFSDEGYTTYLFLSWEAFIDKIPESGAVWDFENILWGRTGNRSWNGLKSIHGRSSWGALVFDLPAKAQTAIKRKLIFGALANYKAEKRTSHHHEGVLDHWKDPVVGDAEFYSLHLEPLISKMDEYIPLVKADMSDADVEKVFTEAVPSWNNMPYIAAALRRQFLAKTLTH